MSNLRQAAQQALDALVEINKLSIGEHAVCLPGEIDTAMDALRAALAEPQTTHWEGCEAVHPECMATPRKPLTDEEIGKIAGDCLDAWSCARAIERAHGIGEQT